MPSKTARWLDLIAFLLQRRFPVTREEVFDGVTGYGGPGGEAARESARRKFERDKDDLRGLGVEIETVELRQSQADEPGMGYRLKPGGFYLPYFELAHEGQEGGGAGGQGVRMPYSGLARIELTRDELRLLDRATRRLADLEPFPLAAAARSVRRKLAFDLPMTESQVARVLSLPLPDEARRSLETLQHAVSQRRAVRCRYHSMGRDAHEDRELEPWGLFFQRGRWYCVAQPADRPEARVFRVDRMTVTRDLPGRQVAVPATFDVRTYLGRMPWALGDGPATPVTVRLRFPESRWVLNERLGSPVEPVLEDGGAVVRFEVRDQPAFLRWLLTFGTRVEVIEPAEAAAELTARRQAVARLYDRP